MPRPKSNNAEPTMVATIVQSSPNGKFVLRCSRVTKKKKRRGRPRKKQNLEWTPGNDNYGAWGSLIPCHALESIFKYVVQSEGVAPFLLKIAPAICPLWAHVARRPSLWTKVDLSFHKCNINEKQFTRLCEDSMENVQELNFSGWGKKLSMTSLTAISEHCPHLRSINVSRCANINALAMKLVVDKCPNLGSIDLSNMVGSPSLSSTNFLRYIATKCGENLTSLHASCDRLASFHLLTKALSTCCPNLSMLDLSNVSSAHQSEVFINIEQMQQGCKKLRILRLASVKLRLMAVPLQEQAASVGFPELEELSIAKTCDQHWLGIDDDALNRILKASHKLKLLDVRGCSRLTSSCLVRLPAWDLQHLFLSQCTTVLAEDIDLVIQKWSHSLVEIDLSWSTHEKAINSAMKYLTGPDAGLQLRKLELTGSAVTIEPIKSVLLNCCKLSYLNLSSCRALPRGIKRLYEDDELEKLRENLSIS